jgi:hypothetical protein
MTERDFDRLFERLNAEQMQADRAADRIYSWSMIAGLALAALCIGFALSAGVQ